MRKVLGEQRPNTDLLGMPQLADASLAKSMGLMAQVS
jgi:hypothetical protein